MDELGPGPLPCRDGKVWDVGEDLVVCESSIESSVYCGTGLRDGRPKLAVAEVLRAIVFAWELGGD
jgi:hypothetical protein